MTPIRHLVKKTKQIDPKKLGHDPFVYIDISSIDRETKRIINPQILPIDEAPSRARKQIQTNDVIVSTVRPNLNSVALVPKEYDNEIGSTGFCVLRTDDNLLCPSYLFYFTQTDTFVSRLTRFSIGAGYPAVTDDNILDTEIPLPPLDEQKRIAAILSKADRLRRLRRYARELSDGYLQSVFVEMFGDPVSNPRGWEVVRLDSQVEHIDSGWSPICDDEPRTDKDQWAILRLSAVTSGIYLPNENKRLLPDSEPRPEVEVKKSDVLITRKNTFDLVAACALVHDTPPRLMLPDTIFRFSLKRDCQTKAEYLWGLFSEKSFRKNVQSLASGTAGSMPNISKEKFLNVAIPLPPLLLQQKFTQIVQKYERLRAQQRESARQGEHLFQSLLHRAFRGELSQT